MRAHSLCRVRQRVRKSSRVIVYSFGVKWVSLFLSLFRCFFGQTTTLLNRELTSVSFSKSALTSFLSPLPPTTPDISVFLPDSGRCELAVRQRFVGRSDPGVAALDQESLRLLPQPLRHAALMRTGPLARAAEAECPVPAVGCSPRGRLAIRSPRGRRDPLALRIDVAAPL